VSGIRRVAQIGRKDSGNEEKETTAVWRRCSQQTRPKVDSLAQRVDVKATWDDLILPAEAMGQLRQMADQVRHRMKVYDEWGYRARMNRGFGITALFAGESGTGKTLAAEVVADHLHLPLYQVDLSAVTSKFIGESEKNLRRIFDSGEESGCILCFNEADTLFSKRVEQTSHLDQFANNIINYLLQRMEAYRGLAILTTNIKSAVDQAFLRRLRFIITFPFPGIAERKRMWERAFPSEVPADPLDYDRLARFSLTGGHVHNAALNAAFLAAQAGTKVQMPLVLAAIRNEFKKLERPMNEAEFRWVEPAEALA
jgi:SpoVK/Ycf46/Vps4 family AAA+-type ATPase